MKITEEKSKELISSFQSFKQTEQCSERKSQSRITPVFREIIWQVLQNKQLTNQDLTDLIQIFRYNSTERNFDNKLDALVKNPDERNRIKQKYLEINEKGYTNVGKTGINGLTNKQLSKVKAFLTDAFDAKTPDDAVNLCKNFESHQIPFVKKGVYSPWLFYINPSLFPLINDSHNNFLKLYGLPNQYPELIEEYHEIIDLLEEKDFSGLDYFAHNLDKNGRLNSRKTYYLDGNRFYKLSHGFFISDKQFRKANFITVLEENNWIAMHRNTGKGAGNSFEHQMQIGDLVYVCYGGKSVKFVAEVMSDAKKLPDEYNAHTGNNDWIYREVSPLFLAHNSDVSELTPLRSKTLPSGNSTLWQITPDKLDFVNEKLLIPKFNLEVLQGEDIAPDNEPENPENDNTKTMNINTILYGPPGTGKTYNTVDRALEILNEDIEDKDRDELKALFAHYQKAGRIYFTTFHQNMAYEDFIEGIKPASPEEDDEFLQYEVQDGLFMKACVEATFNYIESNFPEDETVDKLVDFNSLYNSLFDKLSNAGSMNLTTKSGGNVTAVPTPRGNFSITHAGSTKPYTVSRDRLSKIYELHPNPNEITNIQEAFRDAIGGCNATAYWSVLNEIASHRQQDAPIVPNNKSLSYEDKKLIVKRHWKSMDHTPIEEDNSQPFVFIIDEINRGNVAQIFGELITLIEDDKRMGKQEVIYLNLPYSKSAFAVPPNLYIIGTMNTADRSVEALDTALRRRFAFEPMMPIESKIPNEIVDGINLHQLLKAINNRLRILKDNDHTIGHAWFWHVDSFESLKEVFKMKIIPLLQEYFYNDYIKLGLVLGSNFIIAGNGEEENTFADFPDAAALRNQYQNFKTYSIKPDENDTAWTIADFISIYQM